MTTVLIDRTFERTLDRLVAGAVPGQAFEAWTFDDRDSRVEAERQLAAKGVTARIRSAYKPLLHAFLEEIDLAGVTAIGIGYPVLPHTPENRFRLETYPLAALVGEREIRFFPRMDGGLDYDVTLTGSDGRVRHCRILAPNRVHVDTAGATNLSPTGWYASGSDEIGERLETDYEAVFEAVIEAVSEHDWGTSEPFFDELNIRVELPSADEALAHPGETTSLKEALHEDLYFSLLEVFLRKTGRPIGDRGLRPGQIVPEVVESDGRIALRIETRALSGDVEECAVQPLDAAREPLATAQVATELDGLGGRAFQSRSRAGRTVRACHVAGSDAAVMISAGQHANETTGVVGALRAARRLAAREGSHFTVSPLENPDGYALHQRLRRDNPHHMHHAARYTAFGDDLEYRPRGVGTLHETEIRVMAERVSGARLHVNLHGYPAHEWTRPLSGYVPAGHGMWTVPKGFFLIMRHHEGWSDPAEILLDKVTRRLGEVPGLLRNNAGWIALFEAHVGDTGLRLVNGIPCLSAVDDRHAVPLTLITEYPDETIYDAAFVAGHTAQMETVLAAYDAWQEIASAGA
ncbi:peptidase M14 [Stappia sp.]|uniref:peptidase M14 n=1 Tax=Stappia sp. TaxID=1870903 RepID=UPI003D09DF91